MKITVLISTYNRPDFLHFALTSLNSQSQLPNEVVIADDGSSKDMVGAIRVLASSLRYDVRYVTHADKGFRLARCRNNGIRVATGDFILSTDQDIVFTRDYVKTAATNARRGEFLVSCCVRLTEEQTLRVNEARVRDCRFEDVITREQCTKILKQYRKDAFYRVLYTVRLRPIGPKLRGGVFGAWRDDLLAVNGFDENYLGWGNEDDDLGHRLYRYGVKGRNVTREDYPIHLYHPSHIGGGVRRNKDYYEKRIKEIRQGGYRAPRGITNPLGEDFPELSMVLSERPK